MNAYRRCGVSIYRILLSHKKKEITPFAATWMDLEMSILSKVRQISQDITHTWNLKKLYK